MEEVDEVKKILTEIPQELLQKIKILAMGDPNPNVWYLLYTKGLRKLDGYVRISKSFDYGAYDVNEVVRFIRAGCLPLLLLELQDQHNGSKPNNSCPSPRQLMTWWITDSILGYPITHGLASVNDETGDVDIDIHCLRECFHCVRKSEPLKKFQMTAKDFSNDRVW